MAGQDTGQILKYFIGIIMAVLLTHECAVETLNFSETSIKLQFSYKDGQLHHRRPRSTEVFKYFAVVEMNVSQAVVIEQIKTSLGYIMFPSKMDNSTEITAANITTVCQPNVAKYQCVCENGYAWSYNNCQTYEACGDIGFGSCGCINGVPSDGEICVLERESPSLSTSTQSTSMPSTPLNSTESTSTTSTPLNSTESTSTPTPLNSTESTSTPSTPLNSTESTSTPSTPLNSTQPTSTPSTPLNSTESTSTPSTPLNSTQSTSTPSTPLNSTESTSTPSIPLNSTQSTSTPSTPLNSTQPTSTPSTPLNSTQSTSIPLTQSTSTPLTPSKSAQSTSTPSTSAASTQLTSTLATPATLGTTMTAAVRPVRLAMTIDQTFDISLATHTSNASINLSGRIQSAIDRSYKILNGYTAGSAKVTGFRPGSIIADYTINVTSNNLDFGAANTDLSDSLKTEGIILTKDAFAQSDQTVFVTDRLYPLQKVDLNCTQPDFANGQIKWTVDNNDPALDNTRYLLSNDNRILTVKNASESDSGRYSCIIQGNVPYIQWQNIVIKKRPNIIVGQNVFFFPCDGSKFQLKCSVDVGYDVEWVLGEKVLDSELVSGSITYKNNMKKENCTEEIFTCRLKDLPELQIYSYSSSSVIVRISPETTSPDDVCQNEELGTGKTNDERIGVCGNGMKGTITYKCNSRIWTPVKNNCVLEVIAKLTSEIESLLVEEIPVFMANLSAATEQNAINVIQSAATVQAIVDILSEISILSNAVVINQPVMEDFLKTVEIIVSGNVTAAWKELSTNNTSIKLLSAIEDISARLTDEFEIIETSIQLIRTKVKNYSIQFNLTSRLINSTTEIVIPQVPQDTTITIIIFTTLDNVLPAHGANDSNNSDVRINGDVVVVKVDKVLNNISFTFDITNQSLGNPQCVFWNFSLNTWDSTGCEVKRNNIGNVTCECDHTTSFSILMSPFHIDPAHRIALDYITYIGVSISMASLIICLIIEAIVWKSIRRNDTSYMRHVSIVNIAVSLLIANICFIIGAVIAEQEQPISVGRCSPVVFFMHFFYLALFFWMLISALLLFYRTVMVFSQMSKAKMMVIAFVVGYGAPLLIASITVASTAGPQNYVSKRNACWLNWDESKALLAFVIPALTIVAINLVVLIVVLYKMLRRGVGATTQPDEKHALVVIARCVAILTPIFGITWGFGIGTMVSRDFGIHVVFALLNSLQGFFILVFGTLLDSKVRESLPGRRFLQQLTTSRTNNTTAGTSSTSGQPFLARLRRRNVYNVSEANTSSAFASSESSNSSYAIMNT
ncbi:hypothetical protein QQF64_016132 [Cirrhinus molitorella]|uniref:Adhesion G protein-coupled receptor F5-like n=1 Tax=Cirrhinus molitorella TaxID=172907 RepID=A0ABR3LM10_9TELE